MPTPNTPALAAAVAPVAQSISVAAPVSVTLHPSWYAVNKKDETSAEIRIFDAIGAYGVSAEQFVAELEAIDAAHVTLRLNTPGGDVFDGTAIHNAIRAHPARFTACVEGIAASAGSFIAVAADEVQMAGNAYMMVHEASGGVVGTAEDMTEYAAVLEKINGNIAAMYAKRSGRKPAEWRQLMADETWFTADEAVKAGLADSVTADEAKPRKAAASFDFKVYNQAKIPEPVRKLWNLPPAPAGMIVTGNGSGEGLRAMEPMPMPDPRPGESHEEFMTRCMDSEGGSEAACQTKWEEMHPAEDAAKTTQTQPAPEDSQRSDPPPATTQENSAMPEASTQAAPAQTPAAGSGTHVTQGTPREQEIARLQATTDQGHYEQGRSTGYEEGRKAELKRLDAILAACPDKSMALDAFKGGQSADAVRLAYEAQVRAEDRARAAADEKDLEIRRLKAQLATGGHPGVDLGFAANDDDEPQQLDDATAKARAEREWDQRPGIRRGFSKKENYVNVRAAELTGKLRTQTAAAQQTA